MASERIQRHIERLPDEVDAVLAKLDWEAMRDRAQAVLALDRDSRDALSFLDAAGWALSGASNSATGPSSEVTASPTAVTPVDQPTSFANGRYEVKRFLGEGGKKRVYLAQDTLLDREVAFALIKTEVLARRRETGHIFISHVSEVFPSPRK